MTVSFRAVVRIRGVNPFILMSRARALALGPDWSKPMPVTVQIDRRALPVWRTNMMPVGDGAFYLYLHGAMRQASNTADGDRVRVKIGFDPTYAGGPQQPVPHWFQEALEARPRAAMGWAALPPSRRKEIVRYFVRLRSSEARARNLAKACHVLSGGHGRFMGR